MRVLLVVPTHPVQIPPLGVGSIGALLEQEGHQTKIISSSGLSDSQAIEIISELKPDVIGFTGLTLWMKDIYRLADLIKNSAYPCKIICGGVHPSALPEETLQECSSLDAVVVGEGENIVREIVHTLEIGKSLHDVPGIVFRDKGTIIKNEGLGIVENLDALPFPKRDLFLPVSPDDDDQPVRLEIGRGCHLNCLGCPIPTVSGRHLRLRNPLRVVEELEVILSSRDFRRFQFSNCLTAFDQGWLHTFCEELKKRNLHKVIHWGTTISPQYVNEDTIQMMTRTGCYEVNFWTLESGDETILRNIRKSFSSAQIRDAVNCCKRNGLRVFTAFTFGNIGETAETIRATINLAKELKPDEWWFRIKRPFPGTELYRKGVEEGLPLKGRWEEYHMKDEPSSLPVVGTRLSPEELFRWTQVADKEMSSVKEVSH
ncbi:MAG: radical SAM protein [Planctomycetota bacterium]